MSARRPFHLPRGAGWRFALYTPARRAPRAALLYLHPWAEEMNKCRRAVTLAVQHFAEAGFATLQIDLAGCGDSDGSFDTVSWADWQQDASVGLQWLAEELPGTPCVAWGLRSGALLACELPSQAQMWWQPSLQGKSVLQQFLRLRVAAEMSGNSKTTVADLKARLAAGEVLDIAGYPLAAALSTGLGVAHIQAPSVATLWLEAQAQHQLLPASRALIERWARPELQAEALADPAPWAASELEELPTLTARSLQWLNQQFGAGS